MQSGSPAPEALRDRVDFRLQILYEARELISQGDSDALHKELLYSLGVLINRDLEYKKWLMTQKVAKAVA